MKKVIMLSLLCSYILLTTVLGASPVWTGGTGVFLEGYNDTTSFSPKEHIGIELFYDPYQFSYLSPSFFGGMAGTFPPKRGDSRYGYAGLRIMLFELQDHPFSWISQRTVYLTPTLEVSLQVMTGETLGMFGSAVLEPLVFNFGEFSTSVLGLRINYSRNMGTLGWGLRLFRFRYYLF